MPKQSTFANMTTCLTLVCLICSVILGGAYVLTKKPIDAAEKQKINNAIGEVSPEFNNAPSDEAFKVELDGDSVLVYPAKHDQDIVGYAIEATTSKGFGGAIKMMVGFNTNGDIVNTKVISHSETPGLGAKMLQDDFKSQFCGMNPGNVKMKVTKDGGDVDAITASTITSRAYTDAVSKAYSVFVKIMDNNSK